MLSIDKIVQYSDVCEIFEEELVDQRKEKLGPDLESFEKAVKELKFGLQFRFLEGVSEDFTEITIPDWLTEKKGRQIIEEMELFEQKEWAKIFKKGNGIHSQKNLRILRWRT